MLAITILYAIIYANKKYLYNVIILPYCINCNSTLYTYLFFYYKIQVIFKGFRQRSDFRRGGMFTLKMLINWRVMPIVVPLYSQPKISNSIQPNSPKSTPKSSLSSFGQNLTNPQSKPKITHHQKSLLKAHKSSNLTNSTLRNPNKILNKLRLSLKYIK